MSQGPRCVLITRPEPGGTETAARLEQLGFEPVLSPALRIHQRTMRLPAARLAALLVTSGNAIPSLSSASHALPLFAVGDVTARRARAAGFADVRSAAGDALALAALVRQSMDPGSAPLLLAAGHRQGEPLADALRQAGFRVIRRVAYAADPEPELAPAAVAALAQRRVFAALFFSAETAHQFVRQIHRARLAESLSAVDAVSIGVAAAVALQSLPWRRIRTATRPTQDQMLALLDD